MTEQLAGTTPGQPDAASPSAPPSDPDRHETLQTAPVLFPAVFRAELELIRQRRRISLPPEPRANDNPAGTLVGLAFSGGGIRSATVCLGVLQAMNDLKLLPM